MYLKLVHLIGGCLVMYSAAGKAAEELVPSIESPPPSLKVQRPLRPPQAVSAGNGNIISLESMGTGKASNTPPKASPLHQTVTCNAQGECWPPISQNSNNLQATDRGIEGKPTISSPQLDSPSAVSLPVPTPAMGGTICNIQGHCISGSQSQNSNKPKAVLEPTVSGVKETGKPVACISQDCLPTQPEEVTQSPRYKLPAVSGTVIDAETGKPINGAVVHLSWVLHWEEGNLPAHLQQSLPRLMIDYLETNEQGDYQTFRKTMETRALFPGWSLLNKQAPLIRVYAEGYQRLEIENISNQFGGSNPSWKLAPLRLSKLPNDQTALLEELKQWRKDIETETSAYDWEAQSSVTTKSMALVKLFKKSCKKLSLPNGENEENVCHAIPEYFSSPPTKTLLEYFNYQHPGSSKAADKLGREHNIEALKLLIEKRNIPLIQRYARTFDNGVSEKALEPAIEKLIITHYDDPELKPALLELLNARYFYRNKKLFDLMYKELLSNNLPIDKKEILTQRILNTHIPNLEYQLFELLPHLTQKQQLNIVKGLIGKYKYLPALSYIEPLLLENSLNKEDFLTITLFALPAMANQKAADLLVAFLQKNLDNPHIFLYGHAQRIIQSLTNFPRDINMDWSVVKKTFPKPMTLETVKSYIYFIKERQIVEEAEELLKYITPDLTEINDLILETLISFQSQPPCRQAISSLRLRLMDKNNTETNKPPYTFFVNNILENCKGGFSIQIDDPTVSDFKIIKKKQDSLEHDLKRIQLSYQPSFLLLQEEPEDFVAQQQAFINELKKLPETYRDLAKVKDVHEQITRNIELLGDTLRYKLKKPREAIQQYETLLPKDDAANDSSKSMTYFFSFLRIADIYRYDLNDKTIAINYYSQALSQLNKGKQVLADSKSKVRSAMNAGDARAVMPSLEWVEHWLKAEVNFLETGKPFEGTITKEMQAGFILGVTYIIFNPVPNVLAGNILGYASSPLIDENSDTQKFKVDLLNLPFGSFTLLNSLGLLKYLGDAQTIVDYLTTRDPAHFITASFLGMFGVANEQELLKSNGRNNFGLSPEIAGQLKIIAHKFFDQLQIKGFEQSQ